MFGPSIWRTRRRVLFLWKNRAAFLRLPRKKVTEGCMYREGFSEPALQKDRLGHSLAYRGTENTPFLAAF